MSSSHTAKFNQLSVASILGVFSTKASPPVSTVRGPYEAEFVGPGWLRAAAPSALKLLGAGGWWGKSFDGDGGGQEEDENVDAAGDDLGVEEEDGSDD